MARAFRSGAQADAAFQEWGGTDSDAFNMRVLRQACQTRSMRPGSSETEDDRALEAIAAAIQSIAPQDAVEGMLAALMVAMHEATMHRCRSAVALDDPAEDPNATLSAAADTAASFAQLASTLAEYRRHREKGALTGAQEHSR